METALGEVVVLLSLLFAAVVALFRAAEEFVKTKALRLYAVAAGLALGLFAVYADKIVIK
jgi:hypothetical protein